MAAADLTTLSNVRSFIQKQTADTGQDTVISSLITHASNLISRHTQRQFIAETGASKVFEWEFTSRPHFLSLAPYELRTLTSATVDTDTSSTTVLTSDEYRFWPKPAPDGTYLGILLNPFSLGSTPARWWPRREITIVGDWGTSAIPDEITHWANVTVAIWLRRDVSAFESTFNIDEQLVERPQALPSAVKGGLESWRRQVYA